MGLQHAIEDMGALRRAAATGDAAAARGRTLGLRGWGVGMLSHLRRLGGRGPTRGRGAVWRVSALAVLTYVVAVNLSYFFVLRPVWSRLDGLVEKKAVMQDFLVVRESSAAVAGLRDALMRGDERLTVIGEVEDLARTAGLRPNGESTLLSSKPISKKMTEYPMELTLRGTYHEVGEFLSLLEASPRCLIVKEVELSAVGGAHGECEVAIVLGAASWED